MAQAIVTKFLGATNHRGARIKVTSWLGSTTVSYDYSSEGYVNHYHAILAHLSANSSREVSFEIVGDGDGVDCWAFMGCNPCGSGYTVVVV